MAVSSPATSLRPIFAKQGVAFRHYFTLPYYDAATNFSRDHTEVAGSVPFVVGDVRISIDGSAVANTTNLPVQLTATSQLYYLDLTAAEMLGERIHVFLVDQTTPPTFPDTLFIIHTVLRTALISADSLSIALLDGDALKLAANGTGLPANFVPTGARSTNLFDTVIGAEPSSIAGTGPPAPSAVPVIWTGRVWVNVVGGNSLVKDPAGNFSWDAAAISTQQLFSGDGSVTYLASEVTSDRFCGLTHDNVGVSYADINYGLQQRSDGFLNVCESGGFKGPFGAYSPGDQLQVAIESGTVKYKKNGAIFYTSLTAPTYPQFVKAAIFQPNATINSVMVAFAPATVAIGGSRSIGQLIQDIWYRIFRRHRKTGSGISSQVRVFKEDGTTAFSIQNAVRPSGSEQIIDKSS